MTPADWKRIRHFKAGEAWGDPSLMVFSFVQMLDAFREFVGAEIVISKGTQGTHVETSLHYSGRAADIVFPGLTVVNAFDLFLSASRFDFAEIGLYVGWEYQGRAVAGMHLGYRDPNPNDVVKKHYWIGTSRIAGDATPERIPLTLANLRTEGFLAVA